MAEGYGGVVSMSHFYGTLNGNRGEATRRGNKESGMLTFCASWNGAIRCHAYVKRNERGEETDYVRISMTTWHGAGEVVLIYDGPIGKFHPDCLGDTIKGLMK